MKTTVRSGFLLFICLVSLYLLTGSGRVTPHDGVVMYALTRSLVEEHTFALSLPTDTVGLDGRYYSKYGPAQSVLVIPLHLAGKVISAATGRVKSEIATAFAVSTFNQWVTALTAMVLFLWGRCLGYSPRIALGLALGYGLGTIAWPYSKLFFSEPFAGLCLLASTYILYRSKDRRIPELCASGALLGLSILTRLTVVILIPAWLGYMLVIQRNGKRGVRQMLTGLLSFGAPVLAALLLWVAYNQLRFGSPLNTGYAGEASYGWTKMFHVGLCGLLASPGKGLLAYNPVLILSALGFATFWRTHRREAWLFALLSSILVILHSFLRWWDGGWSWGPRYLLPIIPFLLLPIGSWVQGSKTRSAVLIIGLIAGLIANLSAVIVSPKRYFYKASIVYPDRYEFRDHLAFDLPASPLIGQWAAVREVLTGLGDSRQRAQWQQVAQVKVLSQETVVSAPDSAELLRTAITLNVPDFWWVYAILAGLPSRVVYGTVILLMLVIIVSGVTLWQWSRDPSDPMSRQ